MPSFFIAVEGIDGSGKSTAVRTIADTLRHENYRCLLTEEPTNGPTGRLIRDKLEGRSPMVSPVDLQRLFIEDRRTHVHMVILPALQKTQTVVTDRYWLSTLAYGMLSHPLKAFTALHDEIFAGDFLMPHFTFLLDLPAEMAIERIRARGDGFDHFSKLETLKKIRLNYLELADRFDHIALIDASCDEETVNEALSRKLLRLIPGQT